jgi:hypothetical protein
VRRWKRKRKYLGKYIPILIAIPPLVALIALIPLTNAQEGLVTLNPTDDTYTDWWNDESNYGAKSELKVGNSGGDYADYIYHTWLKFDLSSVPEGAVGITAILELYECSLFGVSETHNVSAYLCLDSSWSEYTLKWVNEPFYNRTSCLDWTLIHTSETWYSWNVTKAVENATTLTIVLEESWEHDGAKYVTFNSKEAESNIPKLTIRWTSVVLEFPTWTPLLVILTLTVTVAIYKRMRCFNRQGSAQSRFHSNLSLVLHTLAISC